MNPESEMLGQARLAQRTLESVAQLAVEVWEEGQIMIAPARAAELVKITSQMSASMARLMPIVKSFDDIAARRTSIDL